MINQYMNYIYLLGAVALISLLVWVVLRRLQMHRNINIRDASLTIEELEEHARSMSLEHAVSSKKNRLNWPLTRMNDNANFIRQAYEDLNGDIVKKRGLPPAAEWLLDNYYVIEEQVSGLRKDLSKKTYFELPVLKKGSYQGTTRIFALAIELVSHTHGQIEEDTLLKYLKAYQSHNILFERELYVIPAMLRLAIIESIRVICEDVLETRKQWSLAEETVEKWLKGNHVDTDEISGLFKNNGKAISDAIENANPSYVEHLFFRLRRSGRRYSDVLRYIDESLDKFDTTTEIIAQKEHNTQAVSTVSMGNYIVSLKNLSSMNWSELYDEASYLEKILVQDPLDTYRFMDINSRFYYKNKVEEIAKTYGVSELYVAKEALSLAQKEMSSNSLDLYDENQDERSSHIGYYIVDDGRSKLEQRHQKNCSFSKRLKNNFESHQGVIYMFSIISFTFLLTLLAIAYALSHASSSYLAFAILTTVAVIIPASEMVVSISNWFVGRVKKPAIFPRLSLKDGIPDSMSAMVVIPALLSDKKRVNELMDNMENHYLGNKEANLYFALIGAFKDSDYEKNKEDKSVIKEASDRIVALNDKYAKGKKDIFYFYNRQRIFNEIDNTWTGWERKRGALMEFNELLLGSKDTSFTFFSNELLPDTNIKYVITLDADTVLPLGMVKKMIGTMAHPLNKPIIDTEKGIVTKGYGLMQPRVSFDSDSSNRSVFSRIYTGQEGLDPYASAISDVYQDLFGEGIFTGKGIYDLKVFQTVLEGKLPENAILSHDLLEGSFVRAALVSDLELVDAYPSRFNSFMARLHRWIRGDWQLVPWLLGGIYTTNNTLIKNPLSRVSKWKMTDNLRRSLMTPSVMVLIGLGLSVLPGEGIFWVGLGIVSMGLPLALSLLTQVLSPGIKGDRVKRHLTGFFGIKASIFQFLLGIVFLPYQALMALDAIVVTLKRVFITKKNMLEWVTSADSDKAQPNSIKSYFMTMGLSGAAGIAIASLSFYFKPESITISVILLTAWFFSPVIAYLISRDDPKEEEKLEDGDLLELGKIARKTWRYFEEFANQKNNYLAPDNYQEEPYSGVAYKTSPTNIGLGLMASLTGRDLGYMGIIEMEEKISRTIATIEKLEKWNGHLYNWYDTSTLKPLYPIYVSTVDSGNLICYLTTLVQGLKEYHEKPIIDATYIKGLRDTIRAGLQGGQEIPKDSRIFDFVEQSEDDDPMLWYEALEGLVKDSNLSGIMKSEWKAKYNRMAISLQREISSFMPWVEISYIEPNLIFDKEINKKINELLKLLKTNPDLEGLNDLSMKISELCDVLEQDIRKIETGTFEKELAWLKKVKNAAEESIQYSRIFIEKYDRLIQRIDNLSRDTKFATLYNDRRDLFYIGYDMEEKKPTNSYYDLLASEARQTSYIAIARGEIPPKHWFMLGRALTVVDRFKGLVSWSGTMFEYLMPLLLMRSYKNTLLDETYSFVVKSQMKYGKQREMPWGTSESAYNALDINLNYQYKAIGVPWLGLKRGLAEDAVVSPYSTFLALMVNPKAAYKNIKHMKEEGLDGEYGFYEAADYTPDRLALKEKKVIIKSFMAHHQGMSLVAINNYLNEDTMQHRFGKDPYVRAARLLLQEKVPLNVVFTKDSKEKIHTFKETAYSDKGAYRRFTAPNDEMPKAHVLSNGKYFVGLTDKGTGYSRTRDAAISRWRDDPIIDSYGTFFYIENVDLNQKWSSTYAPLNVVPENYEVVFTADKAAYKRTDGDIETLTEVVVASGDDAEVRRIQLKNIGSNPYTLQVTSYFELVAAPQNSDLAHPAFSNLFVSTEFDSERKVLLANRRTRSQSDKNRWVAGIPVIDGESTGEIEYETDRSQFIGRGCTTKNPEIIERGKPLSNTVGSVLDPIFSMRAKVRIEPGNTASVFFITATAGSKESVMELVEKYNNVEACETSFLLALTRSQVEAKYLNIKAYEMELYQDLISDILFISPQRRRYDKQSMNNEKGQQSLWQYGISGDRPIVLLDLSKIDEMELLYELLKAHEYWRLKDLKVDLVILSREENSYNNPLNSLITEIVYATQTQDVMNRHKDVFILKTSSMTAQEINLFYASARMIFEGSCGTMEEQDNAEMPKDDLGFTDNIDKSAIQLEAPERAIDEDKTKRSLFKHETEAPDELQFFNELGGFGKKGKSYVINLEKNKMTPAPWVNVIANPNFGFLVSESGGGYTWCENSRENKLTKWSNDSTGDEPSEVIYISDEGGERWSITPLPIREEEPYRIEHGFGYTAFRHKSHGIDQELVQFVPVSDTVKISIVRLHNESQEKKDLNVTYYMTPIMGVNMSETGMHLISSQTEEGALMIENPYNRDFADRVCFMDASIKNRTVTGDRKEFFGLGGLGYPDGLKNDALSGATGAGYNPCGAMQVKVSLEADETKEIVFVMGMATSHKEALEIAGRFKTVKKAKEALAEIELFWNEKLQIVQVETPDPSMNIMLNGWLQYQVVSCRMWARSGFYQSGGAYGFRDQLQDSLSLAATWPSLARAQIVKHAQHQFEEGDVLHWWHEPVGKGTRTRISDDFLWLPYVTAEYIRISGDVGILRSEAPYLQEEPLKEMEEDRYCQPKVSLEKYSIYDHCIRSVDNALRFGTHGLSLIRGGDWNDGMNNIGIEEKGESIWLSWFLYSTLQKIIPICREMGDGDRADKYLMLSGKIADAVESHGWDGNWYRRAYFDDGTPLGSATNSECKIDSLAQTWSVISGAADPQRAAMAMNSLENYLVMDDEGIIKLLTPPFTDGYMDPGYIKGYLPGVRENGGQYTHAAAWAVVAFAKLGDGNKAWDCFQILNPINHARTHRESWIYKVEPYVMAADVYGEPPHIGRGGWSWYTGAAGWIYKAGLENILGFSKEGNKLIIDPSIPGKWTSYSISYNYLDTLYEIKVNNPTGISKGLAHVKLDGKLLGDKGIPLVNDGGTHQVEVLMGMINQVE
ncbi:GH36-type glycosyl hydrolase domain-containing protein [Alkalibacter saccharofermentans]|uniref:Cellobiose phosphorylase n=1 Tax=Alkalibacter saccharofermentans DSM 14828 TaxID=1120975 RepID=A0A1M4UUJ4_9FIRM|nr:glucoamylase family protein [Alkalibacter saccharofermentans]SHE60270.1 Cellobiose phosphorylase [Alkalibacter saccharofermentans DSM 14828]